MKAPENAEAWSDRVMSGAPFLAEIKKRAATHQVAAVLVMALIDGGCPNAAEAVYKALDVPEDGD